MTKRMTRPWDGQMTMFHNRDVLVMTNHIGHKTHRNDIVMQNDIKGLTSRV